MKTPEEICQVFHIVTDLDNEDEEKDGSNESKKKTMEEKLCSKKFNPFFIILPLYVKYSLSYFFLQFISNHVILLKFIILYPYTPLPRIFDNGQKINCRFVIKII